MTYLLTGGSACGKSAYGEALAASRGGPLFYIATMEPTGEEGQRRIARHRALRAGRGFSTIERYTDLCGLLIPERGTVLLECLGNLLANELFSPHGAGSASAVDAVLKGIRTLQSQSNTLILITNEVSADARSYDAPTQKYIELLGCINANIAAEADHVLEIVCGIPLLLKGEIPCIS